MSFTFAFLVLCFFESFTFLGQKSLRLAGKFLLFSGVSGFPNWEAAGRCTFSRSFFFLRIAPQRVTGFFVSWWQKTSNRVLELLEHQDTQHLFSSFFDRKIKQRAPLKQTKLQMKSWQLKTSNWDFLKHKKHPPHFIQQKLTNCGGPPHIFKPCHIFSGGREPKLWCETFELGKKCRYVDHAADAADARQLCVGFPLVFRLEEKNRPKQNAATNLLSATFWAFFGA